MESDIDHENRNDVQMDLELVGDVNDALINVHNHPQIDIDENSVKIGNNEEVITFNNDQRSVESKDMENVLRDVVPSDQQITDNRNVNNSDEAIVGGTTQTTIKDDETSNSVKREKPTYEALKVDDNREEVTDNHQSTNPHTNMKHH